MPPIVTFTLPQAPDTTEGEFVVRSGKIFESGDYPDKDFSMTAVELAAAAAAFTPCDVDLEHVDTVLSGKLGRLESVSLADDGNSMHGVVRLPKWLDDTFGDAERKVSATWDRATKTLAGLALVRSPRVTDAALMAAFSAARHDTPEGAQILQELHNTAARGGAVCKASNTAKMASGHESSTIQKVHDMTTDHGATCSSKRPGQSNWPFMFTSEVQKENGLMSTFEERMAQFTAWLKGEGGETPGAVVAPPTAPAAVAETAEFKALKERTDQVEAENRRIRAERIHDQAVVFADTQIRELRAYPAEKDAIVTEYVQRATDDMLHGTVTFGEGEAKKTTSRVEQMAALFAARPPHGLTAEQMKDRGLAALTNGVETAATGQNQAPTKERVTELVEMTALGRSQQNGKHN